MAPELFKDEENYGPGVDVYAFSILAYEIVTGKDPQDDLGQKTMEFRPKLIEDIPEKMKNAFQILKSIILYNKNYSMLKTRNIRWISI